MFQPEPIKDTYKVHRASCLVCQDHKFCQIAHDILLKEAGYIPKKKEEDAHDRRI